MKTHENLVRFVENLLKGEQNMGSSDSANKDCLSCRLITGGGVIGIGAYIFAQSKKRARVESLTMKILAAGTVFIGIARLLNANFLKSDKGQHKN